MALWMNMDGWMGERSYFTVTESVNKSFNDLMDWVKWMDESG